MNEDLPTFHMPGGAQRLKVEDCTYETTYTADQLRAAVLEERERAANICEHMVAVSAVSYETGAACAAAIRKG